MDHIILKILRKLCRPPVPFEMEGAVVFHKTGNTWKCPKHREALKTLYDNGIIKFFSAGPNHFGICLEKETLPAFYRMQHPIRPIKWERLLSLLPKGENDA